MLEYVYVFAVVIVFFLVKYFIFYVNLSYERVKLKITPRSKHFLIQIMNLTKIHSSKML